MAQARVPFGDLWSEMGRVHDELTRLFGRRNGERILAPAGPAINIWEDEQNVFAEADLPGIDPAKLEVTVNEGDQLTIQGERQVAAPKGAVWHRQERGFGQFMRQVTLPSLVDADKVQASYELGVLRLTLPKSEAAKPKKITVKAG